MCGPRASRKYLYSVLPPDAISSSYMFYIVYTVHIYIFTKLNLGFLSTTQ